LATTLDHESERKKTLCGTPNYIAPEMLDKKGHGFEVDIWAIGCILYTLLVGKPPFETDTLKETYSRILKNQYVIPGWVGKNASHLVSILLHHDPTRRPKVHEILGHAFFTQGFLPPRLPISCLTMAPKFNSQVVSGGRIAEEDVVIISPTNKQPILPSVQKPRPVPQKQDVASVLVTEKPGEQDDVPSDYFMNDLYRQICQLLETKATFDEGDKIDIQDPASSPIYWVTKWVDYSDKYGLGYALCDGSVAVYFNDGTKLIVDASEKNFEFVDKNNREFYYNSIYPASLNKKIQLLKYFRGFMIDRLTNAGQNIPQREGDEVARLPCINVWYRTSSAIVLHLTNGTLQINFFHDHSKLIFCPLMQAVTYIDDAENASTYKFSLMRSSGCPNEVRSRLNYTKGVIEKMVEKTKASQADRGVGI